MKILTVVGARPQFIKAAVLSQKLLTIPQISEVVVHTGQHYDEKMSNIFFTELGIPSAKYNLQVGSGNHGHQTGRMLIGLEEILLQEKPDYLLVYGDTNSTLAGALAACKLNIPIAHVEAGLRSYNMRMPEEINRILTDRVSEILFISSRNAANTLISEGIDEKKVIFSGDIMYDATILFSAIANKKNQLLQSIFVKGNNDYILCTFHRAENTENSRRLGNILEALELIAEHIQIVFPIHPRTKHTIEKLNLNYPRSTNIQYIEPVGYFDMLNLEANARLIMTDSGGVQKEAYFHGKQCVTLRDETEWIELVDLGWNILVSPNELPEIILNCVISQLSSNKPPPNSQIYGNGNAKDVISGYFEAKI
jgi:UDP-GlcNAc3NAcA epimerase